MAYNNYSGGNGGYYLNKTKVKIKGNYNVVIGEATKQSTFKTTDTSVSTIDLSSKGDTDNRRQGGSKAEVFWDGSYKDAGNGQAGVYPWSDTTFGTRYAAGGGGGESISPNGKGKKGAGGAGNSAGAGCIVADNPICNAKANTGGGGGGGAGSSDYYHYVASSAGGTGGSGIVIMRRSRRVKVTFDGNGGTIKQKATQNFYHGKTGQRFADTGATRSGYTLQGWALNSTATTVNYSVNNNVSDIIADNIKPAISLGISTLASWNNS